MREVKKALRKELIKARREMSAEYKSAADADIFSQLKPLADKAGAVFAYASTEIEADTRRLIGYCLENKIPVALPISGEEKLEFHFISSCEELKKGKFGIDEPPPLNKAEPDERTLCVVPALCADGEGYRLGYGKGYYDRFLENFTGISVIICYKSFRRETPREPHDRRADITIFDR